MKFALAIVASVASAVKLHAEAQDRDITLHADGTWTTQTTQTTQTTATEDDGSGLCYDCWYGDEVWDLAVELTNHLFEMDWDGDNVVEHKELEGSM